MYTVLYMLKHRSEWVVVIFLLFIHHYVRYLVLKNGTLLCPYDPTLRTYVSQGFIMVSQVQSIYMFVSIKGD
jgi:hypothetical protein